ncbi:MAG: glutathione S-transferase [SAR86 cluster bacterium]|uniref:Glutathione S-transferase n=1 Tax=SAR86 cluster bacterium TaxID=2030880 RepID=A0A2A5ABD4_9GAMM|nr:MAG: glutathione S-transferase [SAR86 cluster bacterium]
MYKVYGDIQSGNCYKIKLLLSFLGLEHEWIEVDILAGETHTDDFKKMNPNTRIPVLDLGDGKYLTESNAILNYLADGSPFLPEDRYQRAQVLQWQFFEQYSHEPYIATARYIRKYLGLPKEREAEYHAKQEGGHKALAVMEQQLTQTDFITGNSLTIADISLYAYTHVSHEGGFDLSDYGSIQTWIKTIEQQENYVGMSV